MQTLTQDKQDLELKLAHLARQQAVYTQERAEIEIQLADKRQLQSELRSENDRLTGEVFAARQSRDDAQQAANAAEIRRALAEQALNEVEDRSGDKARVDEGLRAARDELQRLNASRDRLADEERALQSTLAENTARLQALLLDIEKTSGARPASEASDEVPSELSDAPEVVRQLSRRSAQGADFTEEAALQNVQRRLENETLTYHPRVFTAFHSAMKVNDSTQMAVLAGISGTGKSQLPRHYASGMGIGFHPVPVQPRWGSPQDLMGFYDYIESRFRPTEMARAVWALDVHNNPDAIQDRMLMILLDEMNLARVEYYFSDFLSRLESRPRPKDALPSAPFCSAISRAPYAASQALPL